MGRDLGLHRVTVSQRELIMDMSPIARIALRYGIGYLAGSGIGDAMAMDADAVLALSLALGAAVEWAYARAKKQGGAL